MDIHVTCSWNILFPWYPMKSPLLFPRLACLAALGAICQADGWKLVKAGSWDLRFVKTFQHLPSGGFRKWGYPKNTHSNRIFPYRPSMLGYPHFRKPPYIYTFCVKTGRLGFQVSAQVYSLWVLAKSYTTLDAGNPIEIMEWNTVFNWCMIFFYPQYLTGTCICDYITIYLLAYVFKHIRLQIASLDSMSDLSMVSWSTSENVGIHEMPIWIGKMMKTTKVQIRNRFFFQPWMKKRSHQDVVKQNQTTPIHSDFFQKWVGFQPYPRRSQLGFLLFKDIRGLMIWG